jgi:hypothetical protein
LSDLGSPGQRALPYGDAINAPPEPMAPARQQNLC